jgi:uncharacterized phage-associated protein
MESDARIYRSPAIANYFLEKAAPSGGLDALQTMKLSYISHGFSLGLKNQKLVSDDIEAWRYGPVIRPIYSLLPYGSQKIVGPIGKERADLTENARSLLDIIFDKYGKLSGLMLSSLTHREGTPWDLTWKRFGQSAIIPTDLIRQHYVKVLSGGTAAIDTYGL